MSLGLVARVVALAVAATEGGPSGGSSTLDGPADPALEVLASRLAEAVAATHPEPPVAVTFASPSQPLADAAATLLAARLSASGVPAMVLSGQEEAVPRAQAQGAQTLVRLVIRLEGEVTAAGETRSVWRNFWAGRTPLLSGQSAVLGASVPADAATRLLWAAGQGPFALVLHPTPLARFSGRTAALAVGDLDGDGRQEVVVLLQSELQLLDENGRLVARFSLRELPSSLIPVREPFGTVCIRDGQIEVAPARSAAGVTLKRAGRTLVPTGAAPGPTLGCGDDALAAQFVAGVARLQTPWPPSAGPVWGGDARRGHRLLLFPEGAASWWLPGEGRPRRLEDVGAGAALVDWEDGMSVVASSGSANPTEDRLRVIGERASLEPLAVPGRILQVCRAVLEGRTAVLLGVWTADGGSELRVVWRRP